MKFGLLLHPDRGVDAIFEEARQADRLGYDSIWLFDHLMDIWGRINASGPLDAFTLMTGLGAVTSRVRVAWAVLNLGFRVPAHMAKMIATLDQMTHGRVICSVGAGWFKSEYAAYNIPLIDEHDDRGAYAREVIRMFKQVWTHPAPELVTFEGKFVRVKDLAFNPAPYQKPHPPIWFGGDSEASLKTVKELADGWIMQTDATKERLSSVMSAPDWPKRHMTVVKNVRLYVAPTRDEAIAEATHVFNTVGGGKRKTLDDYLTNEVVGTRDECLRQLEEFASWGANYIRLECQDVAHMERIAKSILPHFASRAA